MCMALRSLYSVVTVRRSESVSWYHDYITDLKQNLAIVRVGLCVHNKFYDVDVLLSHYTRVLHTKQCHLNGAQRKKKANTHTQLAHTPCQYTSHSWVSSRQEIPVPRFQVWPFIIVFVVYFILETLFSTRFSMKNSLQNLLVNTHKFHTQRHYSNECTKNDLQIKKKSARFSSSQSLSV